MKPLLALIPALIPSLALAAAVQLSTPYVAGDFKWAEQPGTNSIVGNAVMRTISGTVKTCAGLESQLIPVSKYSTEYIEKTFGVVDYGFVAFRKRPTVRTDEDFSLVTRSKDCDSDGTVTFRNIPDGGYYLITRVDWSAVTAGLFGPALSQQGGLLLRRVNVSGGEARHITMTPP